MVEASPRQPTEWWPNIVDPLRRFGNKVSEFFSPATDAATMEDAYELEVELPGVKEADINIEQHGDFLTVNGHKHSSREQKDRTYYYSERTYGAFQRTFRLPADVDASGIQASAVDGVLTLRLPKRKEAGVAKRRIEIQKA